MTLFPEWMRLFKNGREEMKDDARSGRPITSWFAKLSKTTIILRIWKLFI